MGAITQAARYAIAITIAPILGALGSIPFSLAIDVIYGSDVADGHWVLTIPHVLVAIVAGFGTGWFAGWISGNRGKLVGAIANFSDIVLVMAVSFGRDWHGAVNLAYEVGVPLWIWIGLMPAIIAGHVAVKVKGVPAPEFLALIGQYVVLCSQFAWTIFHFYTVYVSFKLAGTLGALITLISLGLAEIVWFFRIWQISQHFFNLYSDRLFLAVAISALAVIVTMIAAYLNHRRSLRMASDAMG